jgi:hypothetical protein
MSTPEDVLRKLAKLPQNVRCANCDKEDKIFGFKNICMPFRTFVCSMCKAAHQSFSHRVKVRTLRVLRRLVRATTPAVFSRIALFFYRALTRPSLHPIIFPNVGAHSCRRLTRATFQGQRWTP